MNIVKRAIIMAAGKGTRLRPITENIPKPMIKVNGKRMIDTVIDALYQNDIKEIHIVTGYLKEKFKDLLIDYPDIKLIENPYYETCNNISSLYVARNYLEDVIILDGDQIIYNPKILEKEFDYSGYNAIWCENETDEWMLSVDNKDFIKSCSRNGGKNAYQLFSISRWNKEDGKRLQKHIEKEFINNKNTQIYWDDVALFCYPTEYNLKIKKMNYKDVVEIDNFDELIQIDSSYKNN